VAARAGRARDADAVSVGAAAARLG
jgi:hypothetical protein